ncbi:PRC-barrel domain containing protein [Mesorhizobium sp. M1C.F.Ca.ET.193.01.1.1]|uniref:PRC-barrel domain-containing protein n=1 Tax=Mesorhizobium sp. TaxID=1871066 RepID=UPI000FD4ED19|nr:MULTISPECIES: PRC-barrel domain-containing protein [unclassified Mesorhizobium]TGT02534.1 PRC-barrel domain containing protein [bacterium M00.F.Ca.ET.177.01.1.1]RWA62474.1 MAG: PRC-barrel domain containing protein [Mesorhizobium sp.]RWB94251.1 MAG: PRC-barrel domain containing protein [Mesorhizobium sp.]RWG78173.1 MAG: PRC-barrel domain containing protein [Mesorhizobium sp.]RWG90843.1 MAG: PRC-barrel domain containing protein [Mesorhizobium sp.]
MFSKLLATTALTVLLATGAHAGNVISTATAAQNIATQAPEGSLVSKIIGVDVYNGTGDNAEDIGEVNDVLLSKDGTAKSLIIGVGGFLNVGEKNVAYDFDKAKWAEKDGKRWLVVSATKEELKALPEFDTKAYDPSMTTASTNSTAPSAAPANSSTAVDKSALTEIPIDKIRAEDLIGTTVYGADDANVGKIGDVVLTGDKKIDAVIIDVGGFLGIGAKEVAVGFEKLKFMADKNGNKYLYTNFTKDQLKAQAAYDKGTYAQARDKQRLVVQ